MIFDMGRAKIHRHDWISEFLLRLGTVKGVIDRIVIVKQMLIYVTPQVKALCERASSSGNFGQGMTLTVLFTHNNYMQRKSLGSVVEEPRVHILLILKWSHATTFFWFLFFFLQHICSIFIFLSSSSSIGSCPPRVNDVSWRLQYHMKVHETIRGAHFCLLLHTLLRLKCFIPPSERARR